MLDKMIYGELGQGKSISWPQIYGRMFRQKPVRRPLHGRGHRGLSGSTKKNKNYARDTLRHYQRLMLERFIRGLSISCREETSPEHQDLPYQNIGIIGHIRGHGKLVADAYLSSVFMERGRSLRGSKPDIIILDSLSAMEERTLTLRAIPSPKEFKASFCEPRLRRSGQRRDANRGKY